MDNNLKVEVRFGDWIGEGWKMFTEQWKGWLKLSAGFFLAVIVPIGAFVAVMYVGMIVTMTAQQHSRGTQPQIPIATLVIFYLGLLGMILVLMPLAVLLIGGAYRAAFKQLRGGQVEFRDLFSARDCYWRLLGATLAVSALTFIGAMLCVIPAFIVGGLCFFTIPLIVDRNLGVFEAMRASRDVTRSNLLMFVLFAFVVQLIAQAGTYACYIGLLATWPLTFTMSVVAYRDCFGVSGALSFKQAPSSPQAGYGPPPTTFAPPPVDQPHLCPNCQTSFPATAQFCPTGGRSIGT